MDSSQRTVPVRGDGSKCWQTQEEVDLGQNITWQAIDERKTQQ